MVSWGAHWFALPWLLYLLGYLLRTVCPEWKAYHKADNSFCLPQRRPYKVLQFCHIVLDRPHVPDGLVHILSYMDQCYGQSVHHPTDLLEFCTGVDQDYGLDA